jgi:hypothetical protein
MTGETVVEWRRRTKKRSNPQNRALHLYLKTLAMKFNEAGIGVKKLLLCMKDGFDVPVTEFFLKARFREVGLIMYGRESTKDLTTVEISEVYKVIDMRLSELTGIHVEFPSNEPPAYDGEKY